jgi:hypothetical protein
VGAALGVVEFGVDLVVQLLAQEDLGRSANRDAEHREQHDQGGHDPGTQRPARRAAPAGGTVNGAFSQPA